MTAALQTASALAPMSRCGAVTMSSREIAELIGKEHRNVLADIRSMLVEIAPEDGLLKFQQTYINPQNRQPYPEFRLPKRETLILISGYSIALRAKIIDRWQELEGHAAAPQFAIPQTLPEALRLAADLADQNSQLAAKVADHAPKVEALERIAAAEGALSLMAAAKSLQVRPIKFCESLRQLGWIYRRTGGKSNLGYQDKVQAGWLTHKVCRLERPDGSEKVVEQVLVTPKGLTKLATLLVQAKEGAA